MNDPRDVAEHFARALDGEDYETATRMIARECEYVSPKGTLVGPLAIVASYRDAGDWVKATLDAVDYESSVRIEGNEVVITFVDHLAHAGRRHTYSCEQALTISPDGSIRRIEHRELPGQREEVDRFLERAGIAR